MQDEKIVFILEEYLKAKAEHESKQCFNLNLIDELHANENAHTRILLKMLSYELGGKKIILEKFINKINDHISDSEMQINFSGKSQIYGQYYSLDGYIKSSDGWAIIIENKINGAADQQKQIDRYIETVKNEGITTDKIYVIYLTYDGTKKVWEGSFTKDGNVLGYIDDNKTGRFVELNYRDDILPLLREVSLPDEESILKSAIMQYIDYLEGQFGIRKSEKEYNKAMNDSLRKILNLYGTDAEQYEQITSLQWELWNRLDALKYEIYSNEPIFIANRLKDFLRQNLDAVSPFDWVGLYKYTCVLSRAYSIPLSEEKDKYFAIDIGIKSDKDFYFNVHVVIHGGSWVDEETFRKCLNERKSLLNYLENNTEFKNYGQSYEMTGTYSNISDLQEKITKQFLEIGIYMKEEN